jgi:hypothetical protein
VHKVAIGVEVGSELPLFGPQQAMRFTMVNLGLCEGKPPRKRKTPVETAPDGPPKKKARRARESPTKVDHDLALANFTIPVPQVTTSNVPPLFLDDSHSRQITVEPPEGIKPPPLDREKRVNRVVTDCRGGNTPESSLTIESKAAVSGNKRRKTKKSAVVDSEDDTGNADASPVVPHKDEKYIPPPSKLEPVIELTKRPSKKIVQSDEEVDFAGDAHGESEDELLIQSTNTRGKAKATFKDPPKSTEEGKKRASRSKPKSGKTPVIQAPDPEPVEELEQPDSSIGGVRDVPQAEAMSHSIPHDFALMKSNSSLLPLHDTNRSSNQLLSANPPTVATEPPKPKPRRSSMEHAIPKQKDSMTSILQRAGLHAPLFSSRLTMASAARIAPLHLNRKTPPPAPPPVPKAKKKVESEEETDEEEYAGLSEKQIARLKGEKRKKAWYSP